MFCERDLSETAKNLKMTCESVLTSIIARAKCAADTVAAGVLQRLKSCETKVDYHKKCYKTFCAHHCLPTSADEQTGGPEVVSLDATHCSQQAPDMLITATPPPPTLSTSEIGDTDVVDLECDTTTVEEVDRGSSSDDRVRSDEGSMADKIGIVCNEEKTDSHGSGDTSDQCQCCRHVNSSMIAIKVRRRTDCVTARHVSCLSIVACSAAYVHLCDACSSYCGLKHTSNRKMW